MDKYGDDVLIKKGGESISCSDSHSDEESHSEDEDDKSEVKHQEDVHQEKESVIPRVIGVEPNKEEPEKVVAEERVKNRFNVNLKRVAKVENQEEVT